ncbi:hypothetical protein [Staphylococcus massiliensis]|uniref:hypothetical protein n=2 Tax=Staphylococcus massiliensis TaxID=555791 RepID=UPI001EE088A3|nr:hypothetical protein [Staphylococcus massiliensis]MCG3398686.1 hypothetical protein [Staphylococcus massiliensis]MCG3401247.1 hypothetical protein [Staphylococcus massiliensis]
MKKLLIFMASIVLLLSACGSKLEDKKEVTFEDVIKDKHTHVFYNSYTDSEMDAPETIKNIVISKQGKIKNYLLKKDVPMRELTGIKPKDMEKTLEEKGLITKKKDFVKPRFVVIDNGEEKPGLVTVFSSKKALKSIKKDKPSTYKKYLQNQNLNKVALNFNDSVESLKSDYSVGTLTFDPSKVNIPDEKHLSGLSTTKLAKEQKFYIKTVDEYEIQNDTYVFKRKDLK